MQITNIKLCLLRKQETTENDNLSKVTTGLEKKKEVKKVWDGNRKERGKKKVWKVKTKIR